jgi:hypothetical protein
LRIF